MYPKDHRQNPLLSPSVHPLCIPRLPGALVSCQLRTCWNSIASWGPWRNLLNTAQSQTHFCPYFPKFNASIVLEESSTSPLNSISLPKGNKYQNKKANKQTKNALLTVFHQCTESKTKQIKPVPWTEILPMQQTSWSVNAGSSRATVMAGILVGHFIYAQGTQLDQASPIDWPDSYRPNPSQGEASVSQGQLLLCSPSPAHTAQGCSLEPVRFFRTSFTTARLYTWDKKGWLTYSFFYTSLSWSPASWGWYNPTAWHLTIKELVVFSPRMFTRLIQKKDNNSLHILDITYLTLALYVVSLNSF